LKTFLSKPDTQNWTLPSKGKKHLPNSVGNARGIPHAFQLFVLILFSNLVQSMLN